MFILGWHGSWEANVRGHAVDVHDSAAVLIKNGEVIAAVEEERLTRVKHCRSFPYRAIRHCLSHANVSLAEVDFIALGFSEDSVDSSLLNAAISDPVSPRVAGREWISQLFARYFGVDVSRKLRFCRHHLAHVNGAWYSSGITDALCVSLDSEGDNSGGLIAHCSGNRIRILRYMSTAESLGAFYLAGVHLLGYRLFDEYKVMGLAPYGDPNVYDSLFKKLYKLQPRGVVEFLSMQEALPLIAASGIRLPARRRGEPFTQQHMDLAAALQMALERMAEHIILDAQMITGARKLCLSGGVAQNCSMNGKLLRSGHFDQIYVSPVPHDAGNALGAAIQVMREDERPVSSKFMRNIFLGPHVGSTEQIGRRLRIWGALVKYRYLPDVTDVAAKLIASGNVIGWVQERSEFGQRALGNRSILADPRPAENKILINSMIKKREAYRPFAPSVLQEKITQYFDLSERTAVLPFMTVACKVREQYRTALGAVTHIDGTARVQTVSREDNARFYALIEEFEKLTGVPVVLNTSFNNDAEPIVDSIDDAIICFLTTGLHALVIGEWLVEKKQPVLGSLALLDLIPSVPETFRLVHRRLETGEVVTGIESVFSAHVYEVRETVSQLLFGLLAHSDASSSIRKRCKDRPELSTEELVNLEQEVFDQWQRRTIVLMPD